MNTQVFVVDSYNPNHSSAPSDLGVGQLGVYAYDLADYHMKNANGVENAERLLLAIGRALPNGGGTVPTMGRDMILPIRVDRNRVFEKYSFKTPTYNKHLVTFSCCGKTHYDEFTVKVTSQFGNYFTEADHALMTYSVVGKFKDTAHLYSALAKKINDTNASSNNFGNKFVATATDAGLEITSTLVGQVLTVGATYNRDTTDPCSECVDCEVCTKELVVSQLGSGSPDHVRKVWNDYASYSGTTWRNTNQLPLPHNQLILTSNAYDMYLIQWSNNTQAQEDNGDVFNIHQVIYLFVPTDLNVDQAIQTIEHFIGKLRISPVQV